MIARLVKVLMLSAAVLAGGPFAVSGGAQAAATMQNTAKKLTAAQMLDRQGVAVTVIAKRYTALPKDARGRSAPFLKGLIDLANAYRDVGTASKARDNKKMGAALPKVATSLAKLNSAYQLSGIHDPTIADSLKSLNGLWRSYLKVVNVGASQKSGKQSTASVRKINQMRHELMKRSASHKPDRRAASQRAHLLALLKEADAASRRADQLWYASMLMAEVYGYYAGSYEYYTAYEPTYAVEYRESWRMVSSETGYFYSESVSYYEEYSWSSYEETVEVSESYDFGMTEQELTTAETQIETTGVSVSAETESLYQASEERQTLDTVETEINADEAATTEAPASDAAAPETNENQPADANEAPAPDAVAPGTDDKPEGAEEEPQTHDGAVEPQDGAGQGADEALPEGDSSNGEATTDGQSQDEAMPDEGNDACAGDNPPADCFSNDEGAPGDENATGDEGASGDEGAGSDAGSASDEGAAGDEGGGDDQSYEEPAQDDTAVEEDSGGGDDSSGGDDAGGDDSGGGGDDE